jgi:hypothetical protein
MAKSRSSDADRSQLKDFIRPIGIDVGSCGTVKVIKNDDTPAPEGPNPLDDAEFDLVKDNAPFGTPVGTQTAPGAEDIGTAQTPIPPVDSCVTVAGECEFDDVLGGEYWVIETLAPPGHELADPAFKHVTVTADGTVTVTFVNPRLVSTLATAPSVIPNDTATVGTDGEDGKYEGTLTFELFDNLAECTAEDNDANAVYSEEVTVPADTDPGTPFSTNNDGDPTGTGDAIAGFTINSGNDTTYYWQVTYVDELRAGAVSDCVESTLVTITDDNGGTV